MIPDEYKKEFEPLKISKAKKLDENDACLFLKPKVQIYCVKVDKGILKNSVQGIKKCDFLLWDEINKAIILIELKGEDIKSALDQLKQTFQHISDNSEFDFMTQDVKYLFACCATSHSEIPRNVDHHERMLCKYLKCKYRGTYSITNMSELLIYVHNINGKLRSIDDTKRKIKISGDHPLPIYPQIWEKYIIKQDETTADNTHLFT